jgi:hypothetical protein
MFETVTKTTYKQKEHKLKSMLIWWDIGCLSKDENCM